LIEGGRPTLESGRHIRRADLRGMQSGLRKMKANIATMRGFGGESFQSAADR